MRKFWIIILTILLLVIGYLFLTEKINISGNISDFRLKPTKISFSSGMVPFQEQYVSRCSGLYVQKYDQRPVDGGRGGLCFGVVKQEENPRYRDFMNQQQTLLKTYKAKGYSFQYDSSATIETKTSARGIFYHVYKNEEVSENIWLQDTVNISLESLCGKDIEIQTTTLGGKSFTYCESKADPSTVYFYTENDKTIVIITQGTNGKPYSYIVPQSVEINQNSSEHPQQI